MAIDPEEADDPIPMNDVAFKREFHPVICYKMDKNLY